MGQILKLPATASKFGFKRVKKRPHAAEDPDQLPLFAEPRAQIVDFAPDSGWFEQALLWDERGHPKAAELYHKAIETGDCMSDAYCNLGIIESEKGRTAKAFDCFTISLKHDPRHAEAHYNLANLYFDVSDLRLARVHYEIAGELDPSFANAFFNLALVQALSNDLAASVDALARYKELVSEDDRRAADELLQNLTRSLARAGKRPKIKPD
jgi:tetratricopeptide (TPR) repeat protein